MAVNALFTPGPILHYVTFPVAIVGSNSSVGYFLGTHVTAPKQRQEQYEIPVFNDLGGRSARFQSIADGEEWRISTTLNRFDYNVVRTLRYLKSGIAFAGLPINPLAFPLTGLTPPLGSQTSGGRGSLVTGQQDFCLILVNTFFGSPAAGLPSAAAVLDLHNVRGFTSCSISAYEEDTETTRVIEVSMAIETRGVFNPTLTPTTGGTTLGIPSRGFGIYFEGGIPSVLTLNPTT
jgi:hypothetical protein